ncbi:unnamed protein product [Linum tenue]|uniref:Uncharacterized protein n=1 Tax=Linum tenue TaxID=586396 RepID=A0AAV0LD77_9ROSI|nr:unnamed protein product [Linum tenue]
MSGPPKRSHEEGGHSSTPKYPHEDPSTYPKIAPGVASSEYHSPYDMSQDARAVKFPRDADRKSPLHSLYRMPSASNDSYMDTHPVTSDSRLELRDPKDSREHRIDNRDQRTEAREIYSDPKRDPQSVKPDKDGRLESRGDGNKEAKQEREAHNDAKHVEVKLEKDALVSASSQMTWKEPKEYNRGKRYSESPNTHADPWHTSRSNPQGQPEISKEGQTFEDRDHGETFETVGENKVDSKNEDRCKDKDRKRKELKYREWGEKERNDRRTNFQMGNSSGDVKDSAREERELDRWERERKDLPKDREKPKDNTKRESWNGVDKDSSHNEKDMGDASARVPEPENPALEQKKSKDFDAWKNNDRERRKEKDADIDGDRPEKRIRLADKESDDGLPDGEVGTERDRDAFNYGVQQRKRMLRSRGSPQVSNRERLKPRAQENEGTQGKSEVSSVVYKVGECMQDLIKLWKEYESMESEKNGDSTQNGPTLEIRIPAENVTATNRQVRGGQLWGTDIYTDDSDLVAVLMHTGYCRPSASPPPPAIQDLRATIRVLPPQDTGFDCLSNNVPNILGYTSMLRNNVRSRAWGAGIGCSYRVERCCIVKKGGGTIDLEPCLSHTSAVEPTLAPVAVERTMTTRAAASNALRQQRFVREVTIQYNLCNEPWIKYSISVVADKGLKKPLYTSARLKKGEVLYLETHSCRYELCFAGEKMVRAFQSQQHEDTEKSRSHLPPHSSNGDSSDSILIDSFRWSRCKKPLPQKLMRSVGIPLPPEHVEVLEENLEWEDVQWSQTGVFIAGREYTLARVHFLSP